MEATITEQSKIISEHIFNQGKAEGKVEGQIELLENLHKIGAVSEDQLKDTFEELLGNIYEAVEGCLSVDIQNIVISEKDKVIAEAIQIYIEDQTWQAEAIKEGIRQADAGNFASEDKVKSVFSRWVD